MHGKPQLLSVSGVRPFGNFERSEQARPAAPTATIARTANGITVPARRASEGILLHQFATEEPLLARRAGNARQAAVL